MSPLVVTSYTFSVVVLFLKFAALISIQGRGRMRSGEFRYAEDARHWRGVVVGKESETIDRAQRVLRNDSEGQPLFLALGALYVATNAWHWGAPLYFGIYALSRIAHALLLLYPRQPHRTIAFGVGMLTMLAMAVHVVAAVIGG